METTATQATQRIEWTKRITNHVQRLNGKCKTWKQVLAVVKVDAAAPVAGHRLRPAVFQ